MLGDICAGSALVHQVFGPACDEAMPFVSDEQQRGVVLGNAIASRWPIAEHEVSQPLSWQSAEGIGRGFSSKRSAVWTHIATPRGPVSCTCTHLNSVGGHEANRAQQMAEVMKFVESKTTTAVPWAMPPILCGDMNEHRSGDVIQYACGQHLEVRVGPAERHHRRDPERYPLEHQDEPDALALVVLENTGLLRQPVR